MKDPVKQSISAVLDRAVADLKQVSEEQLRASNNRGWRWANATIQLVIAVREKVMAFQQ